MFSSNINWPLVFVLFVLPLVLGVAAFKAANAVRSKWGRIATRVLGSVFILALLTVIAEMAPYWWALHLETKISAANPKTQAQLEACLSLYTQRKIQPSQSDWGHDYQLQPGERMTQYLLLYRAPLDVVYTSSNTIVAIYTSYE